MQYILQAPIEWEGRYFNALYMQNEALDFVIGNKEQYNCHHTVNQKTKIVLKQLVSCFIC